MERNEPALAPEWLRSPGSISGSGISAQQSASSSSFADVPSQAQYSRNRTSKSISDIDKPHIDFLDRSTSSNSRRSSSNGSGKNAYSSFNRNHRDRDREKEKESSSFRDPRGHDFSGPSVNIFSRVEKETLRRSHSMISRKQDELFPQRVASDSRSGVYNHKTNSNNLQSASNINGITNKAVFDKNFPSLGFEEIQGGPDVGRVSSPGLSAAVQSLHIGNSTLNGREGWTSALADVPAIITNTSAAPSPVQPMAANSGLGSPNAATALKMAEALAQASSRTRVAPQTTEIQRLEELAIKQSRQLIPVTPSMPKVSSKSASRSGELHTSAKVGQQQLTLVQHNNQPFRGGQVKSDSPKTSHGKFQVLKPGWENGVSPAAFKDSSSLTSNINNQTAHCQPSVSSQSTPAALRNPNNLNPPSSLNRKVAAWDLKSGSTLEKRPSTQLQSRNDFFNLIKKKTSVNGSSCVQDSVILTSPMMEKSGIVTRETVGGAVHPYTVTDGHEVTSNGNTTEEVQRFSEAVKKSLTPTIAVCPDEEEVAFLRSLGWEENSGEDEALTEEEINAFYQQYMKLKPSLKQIRSPKPANAV